MASTRKNSHPMRDIFGDFNDISLEDSKMEKIKNLKISRNLTKIAPSHSRFLKRSQTMGGQHFFPKEDAGLGSGPWLSSGSPPTTASKLRTSAALRKLAQIESKIMNRKVQMDLSDMESNSKTSKDSLPWRADKVPPRSPAEVSAQNTDKTSQKQARDIPLAESRTPAGKGSRFLKKREPAVDELSPEARFGKERNMSAPKEKAPVRNLGSPDSDEEEMKELLGSLMESFRGKEPRTNQGFTSARVIGKKQMELFSIPTQPKLLSLSSEDLSSAEPLGTAHLPAFQLAGGTLRSVRSGAHSPQAHVPGDAASGTASKPEPSREARGRLSPSPVRSGAGPAEESLSEASDDSLNDFRINVLSLDDLAPAVNTQSDLEEKESHSVTPPYTAHAGLRGPSPGGPPGAPHPVEEGGLREKAPSKSPGSRDPPTGSEVSEHLSEPSASSAAPQRAASLRPTPGEPTASTVSWAYSEDFEKSPRRTASEPTTRSEESLDRTLATLSELSASLQTHHPPPTGASRKKWAQDVTRVTVKEQAVQTLDPAFTYQWTKRTEAGMATIGPALGGAYVDPTPIASHVVGADAIEALTAYSPAVFALNDMLKQQLSLTQQFMETSRHLHGSLLQSLDQDAFHYHTLEETKEYIRHHRPAPLTMEDALREVKEEL
uniref:Chromosome 19 open reading frame 44 n=1 Tax=Myotis lucifugus TaxID=59463 RepID=G1PNT2_MYOLU